MMVDLTEIMKTESIMQEGYHAAMSCESEDSNPYQNGTLEYEYWSEGYDNANEDILEQAEKHSK